MDTLTLSYAHAHAHAPDPKDDFGQFHVAVSASGFSGRGSMWVQWQDIEAFAAQLATFPLPSSPPVSLRRGFNHLVKDDLRVAIEIRPVDARGNLRVDVTVADYIEPERRVRTTFNTNYPQVESFQRAILRMMKGDIAEAVLTGG